MICGYSSNNSIQLLIALLRKHGIKTIIASPGTTNLEFVAGLQYNGEFEIFSSVDERSAAYMACGMVDVLNEPVVITCTEATASRDYFPGITEAYYRKLPILVVTGVHRYNQIGHLKPQVIDRSISPRDMFQLKVQLPIIKDNEDYKETEYLINKALLALKHRGGGPVHIDLPCCNEEYLFETTKLPEVKVINRYTYGDEFPDLPKGKVAIFIGAHKRFSEMQTKSIDKFCSTNNAVVFCDHTSGYHGDYCVHSGLLAFQQAQYEIFQGISLLIHIGEATGDGPTMSRLKDVRHVWRVSTDGELRDTFGKLSAVFEMNEDSFFHHYSFNKTDNNNSYLNECRTLLDNIRIPMELLPFSNVYTALKIAPQIPKGSYVHLGVSNTIRAWTLVEIDSSIDVASNVGCRGIDGALSAFVGSSLLRKDRIHFCVLGDLSFFYDINSLGNRHLGNNVRILLINNNGGGVMKLKGAPGHRFFGDRNTDEYIAAANHFIGEESLAKSFVSSLGFEYMSAKSKEDLDQVYNIFLSPDMRQKSMVLEVFTNDFDDSKAFDIMSSIEISMSGKVKNIAKKVLGNKGTYLVKKILPDK